MNTKNNIKEDKYHIINFFDKNNNIILHQDGDNKTTFTYDKNGNCIQKIDSYGNQEIFKYNDDNKITYYAKIDKAYMDDNDKIIPLEEYEVKKEVWYRYDKNGNLILYFDSAFAKIEYEYDENNNIIHYKDEQNKEYWQEFDKHNNLVYYKDNTGKERWYDNHYIK